MTYANTARTDDVDMVDVIQAVRQAARAHISIQARDFYAIAGLRPHTVRTARWRARQRGEPNPVPFYKGTYSVDIVGTLPWLRRTGRYAAICRIDAYLRNIAEDSTTLLRGVNFNKTLIRQLNTLAPP